MAEIFYTYSVVNSTKTQKYCGYWYDYMDYLIPNSSQITGQFTTFSSLGGFAYLVGPPTHAHN